MTANRPVEVRPVGVSKRDALRRSLLVIASFWIGALHAHPEIAGALSRLNAQIAAETDNAALYLERGLLYAKHEDWISAEANYLLAGELAPTLPGLARARGSLQLAQGGTAEARAEFDRALTQNPHDIEARLLRARTQARLGAADAALADWNAGLARLENPRPEFYLERAELIRSPAAALRSIEDGLERLGSVFILENRALELEEALGRIDAVLARVDRMIAGTERKETWLKRRGDVLTRAGRRAEARTAYETGLKEIADLPRWLQDSPETAHLAAELQRLVRLSR